MKTVFIYYLSDPTTGQIRYVGKAKNPGVRFYNHLKEEDRKTHKQDWIQSLLSKGLKPILTTLDEVNETAWPMLEAAYIQFFYEQGCQLTNGTSGGDSPPTYSGEAHHFFGKTFSPEYRHKLSLAHLGLPSGAKGKSHSPEAKEKNRKAHLGKKASSETRAKMSAAQMGKKRSLAARSRMEVAQQKRRQQESECHNH